MSRLAGHGLRHEGAAFIDTGIRAREGAGPGMALCECGEYSPVIKNRAQRKQWHKEHKQAVRDSAPYRSDPAGIGWDGVGDHMPGGERDAQ